MRNLRVFCMISGCLSAGTLPAAQDYFVYAGTFTAAQSTSQGIYVYRLHMANGELTPLGLVAETWNPTFLAVRPGSRDLYAVVNRSDGEVAAYSIDPHSGKLTFLNKVSAHGKGPCFVDVDPKGRYVFVANYGNGSVAAIPIKADGSLEEASAAVQHTGSSVNAKRQAGPHAHMITASPDDHFAIAADLGLDKLLVYRFDLLKGSLVPNDPAFAQISAGAGPRHFAFHPNGKLAYCITEMIPAVITLAWDEVSGTFHQLQTLPLAPADEAATNNGAEIEIRPDGKFVYASVRGEDAIHVLAVDPQKGTLAHIDKTKTGYKTSTDGNGPRSFEIDPTGTYILAGNQVAGTIVQFRIDPKTGRLTSTGRQLHVDAVATIKFALAE